MADGCQLQCTTMEIEMLWAVLAKVNFLVDPIKASYKLFLIYLNLKCWSLKKILLKYSLRFKFSRTQGSQNRKYFFTAFDFCPYFTNTYISFT